MLRLRGSLIKVAKISEWRNFSRNIQSISSFNTKFDLSRQQNYASNKSFRMQPFLLQSRYFSSKKKDEEIDSIEAEPENSTDFLHTHLPATVAIPEIWPYLPCIAVSRNPVFPRFMKILEVGVAQLCKSIISAYLFTSFQILF